MSLITDINIACDAALDQDIDQEDFKAKAEHEESMDQMTREYYGVYEYYDYFGTSNIKGKNE
jgi:hypothetical protein